MIKVVWSSGWVGAGGMGGHVVTYFEYICQEPTNFNSMREILWTLVKEMSRLHIEEAKKYIQEETLNLRLLLFCS